MEIKNNDEKDKISILNAEIDLQFTNADNVLKDYKANFINEKINKDGVTMTDYNLNYGKHLYGSEYIRSSGSSDSIANNIYYFFFDAVRGLHLINRLLMLKRFDVIEKIYEDVCEQKINSVIDNEIDSKYKNIEDIKTLIITLQNNKFKGETFFKEEITKKKDSTTGKYTEEENTDIKDVKEKLKKLLHYDYYLTPFEGIYINENIIGLIKYLGVTKLKDQKDIDNFKKQFIDQEKIQSDKLDFVYKQKRTRMWLRNVEINTRDYEKHYNYYNESSYKNFFNWKEKTPSQFFYTNTTELNINNIKKTYEDISKEYISSKIFNFENPLITEILEPYILHIKDYKVFYLFGNYPPDQTTTDLKCAQQINLLINTENFITAITGETSKSKT